MVNLNSAKVIVSDGLRENNKSLSLIETYTKLLKGLQLDLELITKNVTKATDGAIALSLAFKNTRNVHNKKLKDSVSKSDVARSTKVLQSMKLKILELQTDIQETENLIKVLTEQSNALPNKLASEVQNLVGKKSVGGHSPQGR